MNKNGWSEAFSALLYMLGVLNIEKRPEVSFWSPHFLILFISPSMTKFSN